MRWYVGTFERYNVPTFLYIFRIAVSKEKEIPPWEVLMARSQGGARYGWEVARKQVFLPYMGGWF
jgi:hypothetical protein